MLSIVTCFSRHKLIISAFKLHKMSDPVKASPLSSSGVHKWGSEGPGYWNSFAMVSRGVCAAAFTGLHPRGGVGWGFTERSVILIAAEQAVTGGAQRKDKRALCNCFMDLHHALAVSARQFRAKSSGLVSTCCFLSLHHRQQLESPLNEQGTQDPERLKDSLSLG